MTFLELMERVECNILTDESILSLFENFIENFKNKPILSLCARFYSFKTDKEPRDENDIDDGVILAYRIDLVKDYIKAMYSDKCNNIILGEKGKDISINVLQNLLKLSDEQIIDICLNEKKDLIPGADIIYNIYKNNTDFYEEHTGRESYLVNRLKSRDELPTVAGTKRIYLNSPNSMQRYKFLYLFIKECIKQRIPFDMKGVGTYNPTDKNKDRTVIYSDEENFLKHISIIDSIMKENPNLEESFGSPIISGARIKNDRGDSKYAVTFCSPSGKRSTTYNTYFENCLRVSMISLFANKLLKQGISLDSFDINYYSNIEKVLIDGKILGITKRCMPLIEKGFEILNKQGISKDDISKLRENIKKASSYFRFGDFSHMDVPIYMDDIFYHQYRKNKEKEDKKNNLNTNVKQEHLYLFKTEDLIKEALEEFSHSTLPNNERVIKYINRVGEILRKFDVYSRLLSDFRTTSRYSQIQEYLKTIPMFELYKNDSTKGDGINFVMAIRYYDEIAAQISSYIEDMNNSKKI